MTARIRILDKTTGELVQVDHISFHLGYPITVNGFSVNKYRVEQFDGYTKSWVPADLLVEVP